MRGVEWRGSTRATNDQIMAAHVLAPLGHNPLDQIDKPLLQGHLTKMATDGNHGKPFSYSLIQHTGSFLKSIFDEAVDVEIEPILNQSEQEAVAN